jgi:hypothetical protein
VTSKKTDNWSPDSGRALRIRREYELHQSAIDGLYEEFDKLSKKAPKERLSELALETVNDAIREAKSLLIGDPYVDRVKEFVAAGETPQNSDVLLVLSTLRSGFRRFRDTWSKAWRDAGFYP